MASNTNKLKLLYLADIFSEKTDEEHGITMAEIISDLDSLGIEAERKSIYRDIETLRDYGMNIVMEQKDRICSYKLVSRDFELAELKMLVDSVQSAKYISEKKSKELIQKLGGLTSRHQASQLKRQVIISGRVKSGNEKILYTTDAIHNAIAKNKKIQFKYFNFNWKKEKIYHNGGRPLCVSPWAVTLNEENYYMIAFDDYDKKLKTYRIDKMEACRIIDEKREGKEAFGGESIVKYAQQRFRMYSGEICTVKLLCDNRFASVIIDRFGNEVSIIPQDEEHFAVNVEVAFSNQFISWVLSMNQGIKIIGPENVVEQVKARITEINQNYFG